MIKLQQRLSVFLRSAARILFVALVCSIGTALSPDQAAAQVKTAVIRAAANTSTGTQDFTRPGFGTPKAALFIVTRATANTTVDHAIWSHGAADGTREWVVGGQSEDNVNGSNSNRRGTTDAVIMLLDDSASGVDGEAAFDSWISDGVRINWSNAPAAAYLVTVILFGGTDLNVRADSFTADSGDGTTTDVDVGFVPDAVLFFGNGTDLNDSTTTNPAFNVGFALNKESIIQRAVGFVSQDAQNPSRVNSAVYDTRSVVNVQPSSGNGSLNRSLETTAFITSPVEGFEVTLRAGIGSTSLASAYLAFKFNGAADFFAGTLDTPTSVGNQSISAPGFKPQLVMPLMTRLPTVNAGDQYGAIGIGVFTSSDESSSSVADQDDLATTQTTSMSDHRAAVLPLQTGAAGFSASFVSMDSRGWTWNFSATQGAAYKWPYFAISTGADSSSPMSDNYKLRDFLWGAGGGSISSDNYGLFGALGELSDQSLSSDNFRTWSGLSYTIMANVPGAPTLENENNDTDKLRITLDTANNPSDAQYAIAISDDNFVTTSYVQSDNTVGGTLGDEDWQEYPDWGGVSGEEIIGLDSNTTYTVRVKARQGDYTEGPWGPTASASTVGLTLSFDIDVSAIDEETSAPYALSLSNLTPGSVITSTDKVWVDVSTQASNGAEVYVYGSTAGLHSINANHTISAVSGNLVSFSEGFGLQSFSTDQTSGGPLVALSPFDGSDEVIGDISTIPKPIFDTSQAAVVDARGAFIVKAKANTLTPAANDYANTLTVIVAANF